MEWLVGWLVGPLYGGTPSVAHAERGVENSHRVAHTHTQRRNTALALDPCQLLEQMSLCHEVWPFVPFIYQSDSEKTQRQSAALRIFSNTMLTLVS